MATKQELQTLRNIVAAIAATIEQDVIDNLFKIDNDDWMDMADDAKSSIEHLIDEIDFRIDELEKGEQK